MAKVTVTCKNSSRRVVNYSVLGSNSSGSTGWTLLDSGTFTAQDVNTATISSPTSYFKYHAFVVRSVTAHVDGTRFQINSIDFYGYEEDPPAGDHSVDTTFKSRFNNPQTTSVQVLVDGATGVGTNQISGGPDPSGNQSTYVADGKYWTLNGTLTSNLAVEANTFLEGDQPHAVSVWFNSSNLEANVSNTCVFSIASEEKLDSVNLDLQSNTWHNLTYAYQGEGGSRVTYLDGRKVSEDQAEDTFGDYPPFEMTGYSQGGYVVSASSHHPSYLPWYAFDDQTAHAPSDNSWISGTAINYDETTGVATSLADLTTVDGVPKRGEWIQMEFPNKMCLSYIALAAQTDTDQWRAPKEGVIAGSNDGTTWETLHAFADQTSWTDNAFNTYAVNTNVGKGYKYVRIIIEKVQYDGTQSSNRRYTSLGEIRFYGHRENDLVRLPDPTNVLKYPHVNFTDHDTAPTNGYHAVARRGYVVSASTKYSSTHPTDAWRAFDGVVDLTSGSGGQSWDSAINTYASSGTGRASTGTTTFNSRNGEWINVKFPNKVLLTSYQHWTRMNRDFEGPYSGFLYGSNDGFSTFQEIHRFEAITLPTISGGVKYLHTVSSSYTPSGGSAVTLIPYNEYRLQVTHTQASPYLNIALLEFYGTEEASPVPIQIGGGNIDKVANFRVYDRFIEEDQALEIWDAQKEEFGRAKPQMVLQQGKLGIGTDAPQGSLSVADEPHNLEEFPPRAMTGYETYMEGHGVFRASASDEYTATPRLTWKAFNKSSENVDDGWMHSVPGYTGASSGTASGTTPTYNGTESLGGIGGDWISLEFPYKVKLNGFKITSYFSSTFRGLNDGFLLGRNGKNSEWTRVHEITNLYAVYGVRDAPQLSAEISFTNDTYYNEYALIATSTTGHTVWTAIELRYFGTREQGQSVLHDGQLTLTKNLNVPRIGPPLDADDTPRRDRLVVEYNTSTNPTFEGFVRDTSGRGNDGIFYGEASYDATDKALVFPGTVGNFIRTNQLKAFTGDQAHTIGGWFKRTNLSTARQDWFVMGTVGTGKATAFSIYTSGDDTYAYGFSNDIYSTTNQILDTSWYHVMITFVGGIPNTTNKKVYINGVDVTSNFGDGTASQTQNFSSDSFLILGTDLGLVNYPAPLKISNFKLYDVALTASEVKTLYDMGRTGSVANPQPLHISGPINVMGDIRYITSRPLALPTMWDHMANGNCTKGVYPIIGTQGGGKVYNVYCEPDLAGGGWMCMAQLSINGYQTRGHPTNGDLDLFTKELGDSKNIRWDNTFSVPINILSNNSGYDLDVMVYVSGGSYASRYEGGMRMGAIWRGVNLSEALNPGQAAGNIGRSGLATSSDGYTFTSRTPVDNGAYGLHKHNTSWHYSISAYGGQQGAYNDYGYSDGGWLIHQGSVANHVGILYGGLHKDDGTAENMASSTNWVCARIFVRPSVY